MKRNVALTTLILTLALGSTMIAGCSQAKSAPGWSGNANIPAGAPPLMPPTHQGRFESLGATGCYGCHGANDQANPALSGTQPLPDGHYQKKDPSSKTIDPSHLQCDTCHSVAQQ